MKGVREEMNSLKEAAQKITGGVQPISMLNLAQILNLSRPISLKAICNAANFFGKYIFSLDYFIIDNQRSGKPFPLGKTGATDTDFVGFTLQFGNNQPETQTKAMGDLSKGTYPVNLKFGPISINDPNTLVKYPLKIRW